MKIYTLAELLGATYQTVENTYRDGQLSSADWERYRAVWFYSAPRFSTVVDMPRVREINQLLDGRCDDATIALLVGEWNERTNPCAFKSDELHHMDDLSARAMGSYLRADRRVAEHEYSGRLVVRLTA